MTPEEIKLKITELASKHQETDDNGDAELFETEAEHLIVAHCEEKGYLIKGFPTEKRKLPEEELEEDYFSHDRYRLYLDTLTCEKDDVADLTWHYTSSFWPDTFDTKSDFIESTRESIKPGGYYEIEL